MPPESPAGTTGPRPNVLSALSIEDLRRRSSIKWHRYPSDVIPLWVAEMDVLPAWPVTDAVRQVMMRGETGYSYSAFEYPEALGYFAAQRWDWEVHPDCCRTVSGVLLGYYELLKAITHPGDSVVVNAPGYGPLFEIPTHLGLTVVEAPLNADHRIDLQAPRDAFDGHRGVRPRVYVLCSPHNPTGTVHTADELSAVADLAGAYGVRVISNEIAAPIVLPGARHVPYLGIPGTESAFALYSASKAWNLSGLKAGVTVAGPESADDLRSIPPDMLYRLSHVGVKANVAALLHAGEWLDDLLLALDRNRRLLIDLVKDHLPGARLHVPEGTYLAWLDCRDVPQLEGDPADFFLQGARVALSPGNEFGAGGEGHVRVNFATNPKILAEAIRRMGGSGDPLVGYAWVRRRRVCLSDFPFSRKALDWAIACLCDGHRLLTRAWSTGLAGQGGRLFTARPACPSYLRNK
jgi:cysteine-S-conjugate beta-lyase